MYQPLPNITEDLQQGSEANSDLHEKSNIWAQLDLCQHEEFPCIPGWVHIRAKCSYGGTIQRQFYAPSSSSSPLASWMSAVSNPSVNQL
jgi:hypothetical protein